VKVGKSVLVALHPILEVAPVVSKERTSPWRVSGTPCVRTASDVVLVRFAPDALRLVPELALSVLSVHSRTSVVITNLAVPIARHVRRVNSDQAAVPLAVVNAKVAPAERTRVLSVSGLTSVLLVKRVTLE
jgi:hypothetical protein